MTALDRTIDQLDRERSDALSIIKRLRESPANGERLEARLLENMVAIADGYDDAVRALSDARDRIQPDPERTPAQ